MVKNYVDKLVDGVLVQVGAHVQDPENLDNMIKIENR